MDRLRVLQYDDPPIDRMVTPAMAAQRAYRTAGIRHPCRELGVVELGLGRVIALYYRSSSLYHIHEHIGYLSF